MASIAIIVLVAALALPILITVPDPVEGAKPAVAVIGAGIGGAASAHFLRQLVGQDVAIHVFEKQHVGGRLLNLEYEGSRLEMGGSIVFEDNYYIRQMADAVGLRRVDPDSGDPTPFALYDGHSFVFNQSTWSAVTLWRMWQRYGTAPLRFRSRPPAMFEHFKGIYGLQDNGTSFSRPEDLLRQVGLYDLTQQTLHSHLQTIMGRDQDSRRFASEFVASVNRVNYGQGNRLNALAGMVSMLPAVDSRIFKIEGGNQLLPRRLLQSAGVHLKYGWNVNEVRAAKHGRYELHAVRRPGVEQSGSHDVKWDQEVAGPYDAVIIATPLEHSRLRFKGVHVHTPPERQYQRVTTTYVTGSLKASFFGVERLPTDQVLVTEKADTPFSVISPVRRLPSGLTLYKLFSEEHIKHRLPQLFDNLTEVGSQDWYAYPTFSPPEHFSAFQLAPGIFYSNAWENAASAMEMSAISGRNSALLAKEHLAARRDDLLLHQTKDHEQATSAKR